MQIKKKPAHCGLFLLLLYWLCSRTPGAYFFDLIGQGVEVRQQEIGQVVHLINHFFGRPPAEDRKGCIYISGPMTGLSNNDFPSLRPTLPTCAHRADSGTPQQDEQFVSSCFASYDP